MAIVCMNDEEEKGDGTKVEEKAEVSSKICSPPVTWFRNYLEDVCLGSDTKISVTQIEENL